jgi:hypothetical protein
MVSNDMMDAMLQIARKLYNNGVQKLKKKFIYLFFLLDTKLSSGTPPLVFLHMKERERKKNNKENKIKICSSTLGYVITPFGFALPSSSIPGSVD